ncbi:MAG: hypothetical protein ACI4TQ_04875 [Alloprevotella sp.]
MASLKSSRLWRCAFGLTKRLVFNRPFLAMFLLRNFATACGRRDSVAENAVLQQIKKECL